jgi:O-succinylbenzoic acid--CoA ligase
MITITNENLWLVDQQKYNADKTASITSHESLTYKNLYDECLSVSYYFLNLGINSGDNVGILFSHHHDFWIVVNSLWMIDAVPVPLNTRNSIAEIHEQVDQANVKFLIINFSSDLPVEKFTSLNFRNTILLDRMTISKNENKKFKMDFSAFSNLRSALIMFTSGSSGKSKAVVHTFQSLYESVKAVDSFSDLSHNDLWLASLPLYHIGGFMILVRALITGSCVAFPDSPKHEDIKISLERFNPSHVSLVPTTLHQLLKDNVQPNDNLKSVFLGGGQSSRKLCGDSISNGWPIVKVYGSTETCSMVTALKTDEIKLKSDSSGKVLGNNMIMIKNKSLDDVSGEILINSKFLFQAYYNDIESTSNALLSGWYHSSDYGRIDEEGFLFIETRGEGLIITGGENVNPNEVESALKNINHVKDAFVFGIDDEKWGQKICAAITAENISGEQILMLLKGRIAGYKIPKIIFFVNEIPKNEMGKIKRKELFSILRLD